MQEESEAFPQVFLELLGQDVSACQDEKHINNNIHVAVSVMYI